MLTVPAASTGCGGGWGEELESAFLARTLFARASRWKQIPKPGGACDWDLLYVSS